MKRHGVIGIELGFPPLVGDVCSSMHLLDDAMTVIQGKFLLPREWYDSFWDSVPGMLNL